jgi:hypothetical protein
MKTFGKQKNRALDKIKPYQRPNIGHPKLFMGGKAERSASTAADDCE